MAEIIYSPQERRIRAKENGGDSRALKILAGFQGTRPKIDIERGKYFTESFAKANPWSCDMRKHCFTMQNMRPSTSMMTSFWRAAPERADGTDFCTRNLTAISSMRRSAVSPPGKVHRSIFPKKMPLISSTSFLRTGRERPSMRRSQQPFRKRHANIPTTKTRRRPLVSSSMRRHRSVRPSSGYTTTKSRFASALRAFGRKPKKNSQHSMNSARSTIRRKNRSSKLSF